MIVSDAAGRPNDTEKIFPGRAGQTERIPEFCANALTKQQAEGVAAFPTAISKLKPEDYDLIFRHGFDVAVVTLCAYYPDEFKHVAFS